MTALRRLLQLEVAHEYFGGQQVPLRIVPHDLPRKMIIAADLHLRTDAGRLQILADADPMGLRGWAEAGKVTFQFALMPEVAWLPYVTATLNEGASEGAVPVLELSSDGVATVKDTRMSTSQTQPRAIAFVHLAIDPDRDDARFRLVLPARAMPWTYHVIGARDDANLCIRDTKSEVAFGIVKTATTPGGRALCSFVSETPIALRAHPPQRFELIEDGAFGPRVIVPVLPTPKPGPTADIYVTLS